MGISVKEMQDFKLVEGDLLNVLDGPHKGEVVLFGQTLENDKLLCYDYDDNSIEFEIDSVNLEYNSGD